MYMPPAACLDLVGGMRSVDGSQLVIGMSR